jgi:eukaryotic-like serine/threonine-protein kinase
MEPNTRVGDYEILDVLGIGGMGRVFRVRHVISDRVEAMKVLLPDLADRQDLAARFLREIKVLAALNHPNIAALRTALTLNNQLVMVMEFVDGQSLAQRLRQGPISIADALSYIDQVLQALAYAHSQQVVHRDVKPANMMLTREGIVKLTDFGIARSSTDATLTVTGTTTGSLSYMSPEQVQGQSTDARSDLYSAGVSLYELATGTRPFDADNDFAIMSAHINRQAKPPIEIAPSLPASLSEIIMKAIAKDRAARYQSADEFRQALLTVRVPGRASAATGRPADAIGPASGAAAVAGDLNRSPDYVPTLVSAPPPAAAAAPAQGVVPQGAMRSGHPFLFVALGAALVIIALVGTGLYLGRAEAGPEGRSDTAPTASSPSTTPTTPETPAPTPSTPASTPPATASTPVITETPQASPAAASATPGAAETPSATPTAAAGTIDTTTREIVSAASAPKPQAAAVNSRSAPSPKKGAAAVPAPRVAGEGVAPNTAAKTQTDQAEFDRLELELDQLDARAAAVNGSLDRLKQEQARQGFGLRGDIAARQQSMNTSLARANEAFDKRDAPRAEKFRAAAAQDIEALEKFLGR